MELIMRGLSTVALCQAVGFNPVLPLLMVSLMAACKGFFVSHGLPAPVSLPEELMFVTTWWGITILVILTAADFIIDKIQGIDNIKHVFDHFLSIFSSTFMSVSVMGEPLMNVLPAGASSISAGFPSCMGMAGLQDGGALFWVIMGLIIFFGLLVSFFFLIIKTVLRWVISAIPDMGVSNVLVSLLEDGIVLISVILAFFAPVLAVIFTVILASVIFVSIYFLKKRADERERKELRSLCFAGVVV